MSTEVTIIDPKEYQIEEKTANNFLKGLEVSLSERDLLDKEFEVVSKLEMLPENVLKFRELRIKYQKNRTQGTNKWHEIQSEIPLRHKQFLDAIKRAENSVNESKETVLMNGEKFIENQEKERIKKLQELRISLISEYIDDTTGLDLGNMPEDVFEAYLGAKKQAKLDKIKAEQEAEEERLKKEMLIEAELFAERERQKTIEIENFKLKQEAEAREKALEEERKVQIEKETKIKAEAKAKQDALELKAKQEREKAEEERQIEADRQASIQAAKDLQIKLEREAREKLEAEIKAKADAEEKAKVEAEKEAERLAKAPIKKQLTIWVECFEITLPPVANESTLEIAQKFNSFKKWAKAEIEKL